MKEHKQFQLNKKDNPQNNGNNFELTQLNTLRTAKEIISDTRIKGKEISGNYVVRGIQTTGYSSVTVFDTYLPGMYQVRTFIDVGDATITTTGVGQEGQDIFIKIDNDTDANRTITFGGNLKVTGTVVGSTAASAILHFISDGNYFWEVSRTTSLDQ